MTKTYTIKDDYGVYYYKDASQTILHREDGPAVEYTNGDKFWYWDEKLHREDGPAVEYNDGEKQWWFNDQIHRIDGPAIEYADGTKAWFLNDHTYSEEGHKRLVKMINFL